MQRRDWIRLPQPERPQRCRIRLGADVIDFVGHQQDRLAGLSQNRHHLLVAVGCAHFRVNDEHHDVGLVYGPLRLRRDVRAHAGGIDFPAAGVDQLELPARPFRGVAHAVTGHAGHVLHHRFPPAEDTVHERRLAHVRATDDRHDRQRRLARFEDVLVGVFLLGQRSSCLRQRLKICFVGQVVGVNLVAGHLLSHKRSFTSAATWSMTSASVM